MIFCYFIQGQSLPTLTCLIYLHARLVHTYIAMDGALAHLKNLKGWNSLNSFLLQLQLQSTIFQCFHIVKRQMLVWLHQIHKLLEPWNFKRLLRISQPSVSTGVVSKMEMIGVPEVQFGDVHLSIFKASLSNLEPFQKSVNFVKEFLFPFLCFLGGNFQLFHVITNGL